MKKVKKKIWIKIKKDRYKNIIDCLSSIRKKKVIMSPWIMNILNNKKNKIFFNKKNFNLYRIKVSELGFKRPTKLKYIYSSIIKNNFKLVTPDVALRARLVYLNQKKGEWLRFATPFNSMLDTDGVPHLPKLGRALGKYFIETYWSYPHAIFHPHNEFVVSN